MLMATANLGVVKVLVDAGATLDMKDGRGWTPLMHAIDAHSNSHTREAVLTLLLDAGAAVDVWGNDLTGPLDLLAAREAQQQAQLQAQQAAQRQADVPPNVPLLRGYGSPAPAITAAVAGCADGERAGEATPPRDLANLIRQKSWHLNEFGAIRTSPELPPI